MKSLKKGLILFLVTIICSLCFSSMACIGKSTNVKGKTYGFYSLDYNTPNVKITAKIGDEFEGITLDETYMMISFYEDETGILYSNLGATEEFTWEQDGNTVYCYSDYEPEPLIVNVKSSSVVIVFSDSDDLEYTIVLKPTKINVPTDNSFNYSSKSSFKSYPIFYLENRTYGFYSLEMEIDGVNVTYNVGDTIDGYDTLTEEFFMLYFSYDNTATLYTSVSSTSKELTYSLSGNILTLYDDSEEMVFDINDYTLTLVKTEYDPDLGTITTTITLQRTNSKIPTTQNSTSVNNTISNSSKINYASSNV